MEWEGEDQEERDLAIKRSLDTSPALRSRLKLET